MNIKITELNPAIIAGELDEYLTSISQAITFRRDQLASKLRQQLSVGQTVYFNSNTRPNYLIGAAAIVKKINRERIVVDLVIPAGRFSTGIRTSMNLISTTTRD